MFCYTCEGLPHITDSLLIWVYLLQHARWIHFNITAAWNHPLPGSYGATPWHGRELPTELSIHILLKLKISARQKTDVPFKTHEQTSRHSLNTWFAAEHDTRPPHVATTYLSTERTISSMHPLILFCASKWVMFSVDSPSIAKMMSPMHRLAWAALLPRVT